MPSINITRVNPKTRRTEQPQLQSGGYYALGDPAFGADKKKAKFEVRAKTLDEVLALVKRGHHVRMHDGVRKSRASLISPQSMEVRVDGIRI